MKMFLAIFVSILMLSIHAYGQSTVDAAGILTVNIEEPDFGFTTNTVISCTESGFVTIDSLAPFNGSFLCSAINKIIVNGTSLADTIDLSTVLKTNYTNLKNTSISCDDDNDNVLGSELRDIVNGGSGDDDINGGKGNDRLIGSSGKDELYGGKGNDVIRGGSGNDKLVGGSGKDTLDGSSGNDKLFGGPGLDILIGGSGDNKLVQ